MSNVVVNNITINMPASPETPRKSEKRAPTTPLAQSKIQNKRTSIAKLSMPVPKPSMFDTLLNPSSSSEQSLLNANYEIWTLKKRLTQEKDLTRFLELEQKFADV